MRRILPALAVFLPFLLSVPAPAKSAGSTSIVSGQPVQPGVTLAASAEKNAAEGTIGRAKEPWTGDGRFRRLADRAFWARGGAGLLVRGDEQGVEISAPSRFEIGWRLSLRLTGFGREGSVGRVRPGSPRALERRLEIRRDGLIEWYESREEGVEQGFSIQQAPAGRRADFPVVMEMELVGAKNAAKSDDGRAVIFQDVLGRATLHYSGLKVTDAAGVEIPAEFALSQGRLQIRIRDEGAIYPLRVDPLLTPTFLIAPGNLSGDLFGRWVAGAGDVNGDGFDDLLVSAPYHDDGDYRFGRVYLYLGSSAGTQTDPSWVAEGDEMGYGFAGVAAGAGDVNGDGFDDVIVSGVQKAVLFLGSASGLSSAPDWVSEAAVPGTSSGLAVAGAGDVNGDGFSDILVGTSQAWVGGVVPGRADLYLGSASGPESLPVWTSSGDEPGAAFGYSLASAGDVNSDGYGDVIIGEPGFDYQAPIDRPNAGKALVYLGTASGLEATPVWESNLVNRFAFLGASVSAAGDVNGDGYADVLMGGFNGFSGEQGIARVYQGSPSGPSTVPAWTVTGDHLLAHLGTSVAGAGDVNGDGYSDVAVGEPDFDRSFDEESVGRVYLYRGSASGLTSSPDWFAEGDTAFAMLGSSVASAGDVNGDGIADVLAGAPTQGSGIGRAFLYPGGPDNRPPTAQIAAPGPVECTSAAGAVVPFSGAESWDPDSTPGTHDDIQTFEWFEDLGQPSQLLLGTGETLSAALALGNHVITLRVTDGAGATGTATADVEVVDTTAPTLTLRLSPPLLWPANHLLVPIHANIEVSDACGPAGLVLVSVTSNESDDDPGPADGSTLQDIQGVSSGSPDQDFALRAERSEAGDGRLYTVIYRTTDGSGNTSTAFASVAVPRSLDPGPSQGSRVRRERH